MSKYIPVALQEKTSIFVSTTLDKISWDSSPFFLSVVTCLCDTLSPPINVDCYALLFAASAAFISTFIGGEGEMMEFVFPDVHFDIEEDQG